MIPETLASYNKAQRRIAKCRGDRGTKLDFSDLKLTQLPEIGHIPSLKTFDISNNLLKTWPSQLAQLTSLTLLDLSGNQLASLPPQIGKFTSLTELRLSHNQLASLSPEIGQLASLRVLGLSSNKLASLPPEVCQLTLLTHLILDNNLLGHLPPEIGNLKLLRFLNIGPNQITCLPPQIGQLTSLIELHLDRNEITTLGPEIGQLTSLEKLYLNINDLRNLPRELFQLTSLKALFLHDNPGLEIPPAMLGPMWLQCKGHGGDRDPTPPTEILDYYFNTRGDAGQALREVKVILLGRGEVGKTSLVDVLQRKPFLDNRARTDGIALTSWPVKLDDGEAELTFWDFGGQEIMHGTHQFFMTHRSLYVVMVDGRHDRARQDAEYWLKMVRAFGGESPVMIVMNRQKGHAFDLDREALAQKHGVHLDHFFRTDCGDEASLAPLREAILNEAARMLAAEERFPKRCWAVKTRLTEMKQHGEDYLSDQDYSRLCDELGVPDEAAKHRLLRRLADLGTVVSFPDDVRLSALSVLNPEWATDGIYRVITHEELRDECGGVLPRQTLRKLLPKDRWPRDQHVQYVVDLMQKFDLCFPVDEKSQEMLVPELLPDKTPPLGDWEAARCVVFQYHYPVLPHGILPRFITRTHAYSQGQARWRSGVILADDGAQARLQADYDANTLSIWVRGEHADARRALLKIIRHEFRLIHGRIEGLSPKEMVAVPGHPGTLLRYQDLIADERAGERTIKVTLNEGLPNEQRVKWQIFELLNGVESLLERMEAEKLDEEEGRRVTYIHYDQRDQRDQSVNIEGDAHDSLVAHGMNRSSIDAGRSAHAPLDVGGRSGESLLDEADLSEEGDFMEAGRGADGTSKQTAFNEKSKHQTISKPMSIDQSIQTGNVIGGQVAHTITGSTNSYTDHRDQSQGKTTHDDHSTGKVVTTLSGNTITHSNVGGVLSQCSVMVQNQPEGEVRTLLEDLIKEMTEVIQRLPEDKQEEAANDLKMVTEMATSEKPTRKWYDVSAAGLLEAAQFVGEFSEKIGDSVGKIATASGNAATFGAAESIRGIIESLKIRIWP